jgi:Fe-S cluster assembly protein SufD
MSIAMANTENSVLPHLVNMIGSIPAIQKIREDCYASLQHSGLPGTKHEEYRNTPLTRALEKFDLSSGEFPSSPGTERPAYRIPELDEYSIVFINGKLSLEQSSASGLSKLKIRPLREALESGGQAIAYFSKIADPKLDAFLAWNTVGWNSGVYIEVDDNVTIEKPLVIYNITDASERQVVTIARNLLVVGKNCALTVIQKFDSVGAQPHFTNTVTEAVVEDHSSLTIYTIQNDPGDHYQFNHTQIQQQNSSRVNSFFFTLSGKLIRNNLNFSVDGEDCESHLYGLYLLKGDTLADNHTVADHLKPNSSSNELYKGVMDDRSKGVFNGKIYVRPNAQKTNAFQSNRNILLTDLARVNTKPQLEIWADDVRCSHGCTTGQLDEEAVFYLQSRGIPKPMAQAMLLYAFAGEVIDMVTILALKQYLEKIVNDRLEQPNQD